MGISIASAKVGRCDFNETDYTLKFNWLSSSIIIMSPIIPPAYAKSVCGCNEYARLHFYTQVRQVLQENAARRARKVTPAILDPL